VLSATAIEGLPEIRPGDDLAEIFTTALRDHPRSPIRTSS